MGAGPQVLFVVSQYSWYRQPFAPHVLPDGHWHDAWVLGPTRLPHALGAAASDFGASPHTPPCGTHAPT
jgi:hypothetical protein